MVGAGSWVLVAECWGQTQFCRIRVVQTSVAPKLFLTVFSTVAAWLWNAMRGRRTQSGLVMLSQTCQGVEELKYGWERPKYMENKSVWIYKLRYLWHQLGNQPVPVWGWLIQLLQAASGSWSCSSSPGKVQQVRDRTDSARKRPGEWDCLWTLTTPRGDK